MNFFPQGYPTQTPRYFNGSTTETITVTHPATVGEVIYTNTVTLTVPYRIKLLALSARVIFQSVDFTTNDTNLVKVTAETKFNEQTLSTSGTSESEIFFFGSPRTFHASELQAPIYPEPNDTISVKVTTAITRNANSVAVFKVNISLQGEVIY